MSDKDISDPANAEDPPPDAPELGTCEDGAGSPFHAEQERGSEEAPLQPIAGPEPGSAEAAAFEQAELPSSASIDIPCEPPPPADDEAQLAFEFAAAEPQAPCEMAEPAMEDGSSQPGSFGTLLLKEADEESRGATAVDSEDGIESAQADVPTTEPAEGYPVCNPCPGFEDGASAPAPTGPEPDCGAETVLPVSPAEATTDTDATPSIGAVTAVEPVSEGEAHTQPGSNPCSAEADAVPAIEAAPHREDALDQAFEADAEESSPRSDSDPVPSPAPIPITESNSPVRNSEQLAPALGLSAFTRAYGELRAHPRNLPWDRAPPERGVLVRLARWLALAVTGIVLLLLALILLYRVVDPPLSALMAQRWLAGDPPQRTWVPLGRISPQLVQAVIVSEDARFCQHWGIDLKEVEAALERAREGVPRGASTISMQVAKNLFLWPAKSYLRKAMEVPLALGIELFWPKQRILEVYLNIAEWGPGLFGAEAAARHHFGKAAARLGEREAALLAVSLPDPLDRRAGAPGPGLSRLATTIQLRMRAAGNAADCVLSRKPRAAAGKL